MKIKTSCHKCDKGFGGWSDITFLCESFCNANEIVQPSKSLSHLWQGVLILLKFVTFATSHFNLSMICNIWHKWLQKMWQNTMITIMMIHNSCDKCHNLIFIDVSPSWKFFPSDETFNRTKARNFPQLLSVLIGSASKF